MNLLGKGISELRYRINEPGFGTDDPGKRMNLLGKGISELRYRTNELEKGTDKPGRGTRDPIKGISDIGDSNIIKSSCRLSGWILAPLLTPKINDLF